MLIVETYIRRLFPNIKLLSATIFTHVSINHVFQIVCFTYGRKKSTSPSDRKRY